MPCEKHGPRASVTTKTSAFGLGFCLLSPSGHVFHTAWETMIKSYNNIHLIKTTIVLGKVIQICLPWNQLSHDKYDISWIIFHQHICIFICIYLDLLCMFTVFVMLQHKYKYGNYLEQLGHQSLSLCLFPTLRALFIGQFPSYYI